MRPLSERVTQSRDWTSSRLASLGNVELSLDLAAPVCPWADPDCTIGRDPGPLKPAASDIIVTNGGISSAMRSLSNCFGVRPPKPIKFTCDPNRAGFAGRLPRSARRRLHRRSGPAPSHCPRRRLTGAAQLVGFEEPLWERGMRHQLEPEPRQVRFSRVGQCVDTSRSMVRFVECPAEDGGTEPGVPHVRRHQRSKGGHVTMQFEASAGDHSSYQAPRAEVGQIPV